MVNLNEVVKLHKQGFSCSYIANIMGCTSGNISHHLRRSGLTLLLDYIAMMASEDQKIYPGAIVFMSKGLHCYSHYIETMEMRTGKRIKDIYLERHGETNENTKI